MSFRKLFNAVKASRKRGKLSPDTFNSRLKEFQSGDILSRTDRGYKLTEKAHFLHALKILDPNPPNRIFLEPENEKEKERNRRTELENSAKMHLMISLYGSRMLSYNGLGSIIGLGVRRLNSETQFQEFLSRYNLNIDSLRKRREYDVPYKDGRKHIKEFSSDSVHGIGIRIVEESLGDTHSVSYEYAPPGFCISEILKDTEASEFRFLPFDRSVIQNEIRLLLDNGIVVEHNGVFDGEKRYNLDRYMRTDIDKCWELYYEIFDVVTQMCKTRNPTKEEKRWFGFFYGSEPNGPLERYLQDLRRDRHKVKRSKKYLKTHDIETLMFFAHKKFKKLIESLDPGTRYTFFIEKMLEFIYPFFMRNSFRNIERDSRRKYHAQLF